MELKEFIKDTISQIADAVDELNKRNDGVPLIVNPTSTNGKNMINKAGSSYNMTTINFNIALSVSDEGSSGGKIGVFAGWIGGAATSENKNQSQALTSLNFQLDVVLPQG